MTAAADVFFVLTCFAGGLTISYFAGWLFSEALTDMEHIFRLIGRFIKNQ